MTAVTTQTMRESDQWTIEHLVPSRELMYRAGKGIFEAAKWVEPVAIICGKGNNAGDGFVVASLLKEHEIPCHIFLLSDSFSEDGKYYFDKAVEMGVPYTYIEEIKNQSADEYSQYLLSAINGYHSILDCILGTGFRGEVRKPLAYMIRVMNQMHEMGVYVVSADINSGLNGDTGEGNLYVISDLTVSIGTYKVGLFCGQAKYAMKEKVNVDIGIKIIGPVLEMEEQ